MLRTEGGCDGWMAVSWYGFGVAILMRVTLSGRVPQKNPGSVPHPFLEE